MTLLQPKPKTAHAGLYPKIHTLMEEAVAMGVASGWRRAYKYNDYPAPLYVREAIEEAVLMAIADRFSYVEQKT